MPGGTPTSSRWARRGRPCRPSCTWRSGSQVPSSTARECRPRRRSSWSTRIRRRRSSSSPTSAWSVTCSRWCRNSSRKLRSESRRRVPDVGRLSAQQAALAVTAEALPTGTLSGGGLARQAPQIFGGKLAGRDQQRGEILKCPGPAKARDAKARIPVADVLTALGHRVRLPANPLRGLLRGAGGGRTGVPPCQVLLEPCREHQPVGFGERGPVPGTCYEVLTGAWPGRRWGVRVARLGQVVEIGQAEPQRVVAMYTIQPHLGVP